MWKAEGKPKTVKVTHKLAQQFCNMQPAPNDRPLSERRLQVYERMVKEGLFRPVSWIYCECEETGDTYRINGKHTSTLFSALDPLPELYAVIESYYCDSLVDVANLYSTCDSSDTTRSATDIYKSFAACEPALAKHNSKDIQLCVAGIDLRVNNGMKYQKGSRPADRAERMLEYVDWCVWAIQMGSTAYKHMRRAPVFGAMLATWQRSHSDATTFWDLVRTENGSKPNDPHRKLAKFLCTAGLEATRVKRVTTHEMYVKCLHAWNAWRRHETTNLNYRADKPAPAIK